MARRSGLAIALSCAALTIGVAGCEDKPAPQSAGAARDLANKIGGGQDAAANAANDITGQGNEVMAGGVTFKVPESWQKKTADPAKFQTAAYEIPSGGDGAPIQIVFFGTIGGNVNSNVERWRGQVHKADGSKADAKIENATVNGMNVTMVSMEGSYTGRSGSPIPDAGFRAALIEQAMNQSVCIRMTGTRADIEAKSAEFWAMVKSASK